MELPALLERQTNGQQAMEAAKRLESAIQLAAQTLEPIRLRHDAARMELQQLDGLQAEIQQRQERLAALHVRAKGAEAEAAELSASQQQRQAGWDGLNRQQQSLERQLHVLQLLVDRAGSVETLGQLDQQLRDAHTRQQAMAAGVKLLHAGQQVRLDGGVLTVGDEQRLSTAFQLQVGDGVIPEISPGGGQALGDLERTVAMASQALAGWLRALGCTECRGRRC